MSTEFDPKIAEFTATGATAVLILDAQKRLCGILVDLVLQKMDRDVTDGLLTPDRAIGYCHEIAAFRRIVARQQQDISQARAVALRSA